MQWPQGAGSAGGGLDLMGEAALAHYRSAYEAMKEQLGIKLRHEVQQKEFYKVRAAAPAASQQLPDRSAQQAHTQGERVCCLALSPALPSPALPC